MPYDVFLTDDAAKDLDNIYDYIFDHDSPERAGYVINEIKKVFHSLASFPERGAYPQELLDVRIMEYREVYFKPYRIIYRIEEQKVYVYLIVDGRRNLRTILMQRLLR